MVGAGQNTTPDPSSGINVCIGGYDGSVAGLTLSSDETTALSLRLNFAYDAHVSAVRSAALHGSTLVTGGTDETIRIYDLSRRVEVGTLMLHDGTINALHFANDAGRELLFSASDDFSISVCRVSDWECLKKLSGHQAPVLDVAVHPSAQLALSVAKDRSLFMWNLVRGRIAFSAKTKERPATKVMWAPDGNKYLLASGDMVSLSHVEKKGSSSFKHSRDVLCAEFMDVNTFFTGGEEKVVRMWDSRSSKKNDLLLEHGKRVKDVQLVENLLLSADAGGEIKVWDIRKQGTPRIETALGDGGLRLTCMVSASEVKPNYGEPTAEEARLHKNVDQEAGRGQTGHGKRARGKNKRKGVDETEDKRTDTASQRKRKKRKLQKSLEENPTASEHLSEAVPRENTTDKEENDETEDKVQDEVQSPGKRRVPQKDNASQKKRKKRKHQT